MTRKHIFFTFILIVFLCSIFSLSASAGNAPNTYAELYKIMAEDVLEGKTEVVYHTNFEPKNLDLEKIKEIVKEVDEIQSYCVYSIKWNYPATNSGTYSATVQYRYYMTLDEREMAEKKCATIAKALEGKSDFEKVKYVHDFLIQNCEYSIISDGPYNCLYKGKACCNGYALAFLMIMDRCGIPCKYVESSNHAWNEVYLDGCWYNIDVTWDDGEEELVLYDYFLKSNADFPKHSGAGADAFKSYDLENLEANRIKFPLFHSLRLFLNRYWLIIALVAVTSLVVVVQYVNLGKKKEDPEQKLRDMFPH